MSQCDRALSEMPARASSRQRWCEGCEQRVHVLSRYSEAEARALLSDSGGVCVSYEVDEQDRVRLRRTQLDRVGVTLASMALMASVASLGLDIAHPNDASAHRLARAAPQTEQPRAAPSGSTTPSEPGRPFTLPEPEPEPLTITEFLGGIDTLDDLLLLSPQPSHADERVRLTSMGLRPVERLIDATARDLP